MAGRVQPQKSNHSPKVIEYTERVHFGTAKWLLLCSSRAFVEKYLAYRFVSDFMGWTLFKIISGSGDRINIP